MEKDAVLPVYADACRRVAGDYVERATRFGAADLKILNASPTSYHFSICIRHSLEVLSDAQDHAGVVEPEASDSSTLDWAFYQESVEKQAVSERSRQETLIDLATVIQSQPYAYLAERSLIRTHPRRFFHSYKCENCHSAGHLRCDDCRGSGAVSCGKCGGDGDLRCSSCGGSGLTMAHYQVQDRTGHYRTESRNRPCDSCSNGRIRCGGCGGRGQNTCQTCNGSGQITCKTCEGHGHLTRITSTMTYTLPAFQADYPQGTPDYVHNALCKAGFPNLQQYGEVAFESAGLCHDAAYADFHYRSTMFFCDLSLSIVGHSSNWILYGEPPRIYDAGEIFEVLLKDDVDRLDRVSAGGAFLLPWFYRRAEKVIAPFMASEIHQDIVDAHSLWLQPDAITEKVGRALSAKYIARSINRLRQTVLTAARWSSIKWTLGISIAALPLIVLSVVLMELTAPHAMLATQDRLVLFPWNTGGFTPWIIAFFSVPFSLTGWFFAKWVSLRWIKRAGGKCLSDWAHRKNLLLGKKTAIAITVTTAITAGYFFSAYPIWMDKEGKLYGFITVFQKPQQIEPAVPPQPNLENLNTPRKTKGKSKKHEKRA